jgi:RNA polymerase sigma factor (sigma-70 family)
MVPDGDATESCGRARLLEQLNEQRERFLTFVRWRSTGALGARRDPEDVLQLAFINACERWMDLERSGMALDAWFYRIILNVLFDDHDFHSRQRRDHRLDMNWPDRSSVQAGLGLRNADTSPSEALGRKETKARIDRVLAMLPPDQQQIMVLVHFAELTREQASELLGIEGATARQRYARARARFRETWKSLFGDEDLRT